MGCVGTFGAGKYPHVQVCHWSGECMTLEAAVARPFVPASSIEFAVPVMAVHRPFWTSRRVVIFSVLIALAAALVSVALVTVARRRHRQDVRR
jgi:hypothetical protein